MKKSFVVIMLITVLMISACSNGSSDSAENKENIKMQEVKSVCDREEIDNVVEDEAADMSDWTDFTGGDIFEPITDGYDKGVEIEIESIP